MLRAKISERKKSNTTKSGFLSRSSITALLVVPTRVRQNGDRDTANQTGNFPNGGKTGPTVSCDAKTVHDPDRCLCQESMSDSKIVA